MQATAENFAQAQAGDERAKEILFKAYHRLATKVAWKYSKGMGTTNAAFDAGEAISVAYEGLTKAINRFRPEYGNRFSTYAIPMIEGELRRHLRDNGPGGIRVPRSLREKGVRAKCTSLNAPVNDDDGKRITLQDVIPTTCDIANDIDTMQVVEKVITTFDERSQEVIRRRLGLDLVQMEIATKVGTSQAQVSRIMKKFKEQMEREFIVSGIFQERKGAQMRDKQKSVAVDEGIPEFPVKEYMDLSSFVKIENTKPAKKADPYLTVKGRTIKLVPAAVEVAPEEYRRPGKMTIYVAPNGKQIAIQPEDNGIYEFRESKLNGSLSGYASAAIAFIQDKGVQLPAKYTVRWNEKYNAWEGNLIVTERS